MASLGGDDNYRPRRWSDIAWDWVVLDYFVYPLLVVLALLAVTLGPIALAMWLLWLMK